MEPVMSGLENSFSHGNTFGDGVTAFMIFFGSNVGADRDQPENGTASFAHGNYTHYIRKRILFYFFRWATFVL